MRAGALGDLLLLRSAVASLNAARHEVTLLAPAAGTALVGTGPCDVVRHLPWDGLATTRLLAGDPSASDWLAPFTGALCYSRDVDLARGLSAVIPRVVVHDPLPPAAEHASLWFARAVEGLDVPIRDAPPGPTPAGAEIVLAREWLDRLPPRFLAVHPGSGSSAKNWPADRFAALAEALSPDGAWLLCLGPAEASWAGLRGSRALVAEGLPLRVLGAVLSACGVFVGNDSGVSHLAAAWGAPTLALFGPTDPAVWAPIGPRVRVLRAPEGDLDRLSVEAVVAGARDYQCQIWS